MAFAVPHNGQFLLAQERQHRAVSASTRRLVLAAAAHIGAPGTTYNPDERPDPVGAPTLTLARIAAFQRDGAIP